MKVLHDRLAVPALCRIIAVWICAGILVPTLSTADDLVLTLYELGQFRQDQPDEFRRPAPKPVVRADEYFWIQFEVYERPVTTNPTVALASAGRPASFDAGDPRTQPIRSQPSRGPPLI